VRQTICMPACFSFIDNPEETLIAIYRVAEAESEQLQEIQIDQRQCKSIDLCAAAVLNVVAQAIQSHRGKRAGRGSRRALVWRGSYPTDQAMKEIVAVTGLPRTLGAEVPQLASLTRFHSMGLVMGGFTGTRAVRNSKAEIGGTKVVEYFQSCLKRFGYRLLPTATEHISRLTAEILNNCEDHSGRSEWWMAAYLRIPEGSDASVSSSGPGDFHLTIFNFGASIAATMEKALADNPKSAQATERIRPILQSHAEQGESARGSDSRAKSLCVCALQPNVSRFNTSEDVALPGDRGQGTVQFIESFALLGAPPPESGEQPEAAILSGNVHIRLRGHTISDGRFLGLNVERVIALNASNDIGMPPDPESVTVLGAHFPGTIISLRFMLDRKHLATQGKYVESDAN
jgi:hypothetical protein